MLAVTEWEILSTGRDEAELVAHSSWTSGFCFSFFFGTGEDSHGGFAHLRVSEGKEFVRVLEDVVVGLVGEGEDGDVAAFGEDDTCNEKLESAFSFEMFPIRSNSGAARVHEQKKEDLDS